MLMRRFIAVLFVPLLLIAACGEPDAPPPETQPDVPRDRTSTEADTSSWRSVDELTDEQKLMLVEEIPLGSTYEEVRQQYPSVGPEEPEGQGATAHLSQAHLPVEVMDRDALIEFNFDEQELYSFYYRIDSVDCNEGEELYRELQSFYTDYYGDARQEEEPEDGYVATSSYWRMGEAQGGVALTLGRQDGICRLGWGFQRPAPY